MNRILHTARYAGLPWEILKSVVPEDFEVKTLDELSYYCCLMPLWQELSVHNAV